MIFHAWLASYTHEQDSGRTTYYYDYLSQAFLQGNLHLSMQPDPRLLASENPYDLSVRAQLEKQGVVTPVDLSLYEGKFYLYWGPVPALLLSFVQLFSGQPQSIADFFLAFLFGIGILLTQTLLLTAAWRQYFSALSPWAYYISLLLAGLIWPVALLRHEHNHARIYEAAIAAGQFFMIGGIWMAFTALTRPSTPNWRLALAGFIWALAIGSRHLLLIPIGIMVILTIFWILRSQMTYATRIAKVICLSLPLAVGGSMLAWYNWARFDSITETGYAYQLAGVDLIHHFDELFSGSYMIQNLYNYLLNPPQLLSDFPFVAMLKGNNSLGLPFYFAEPVTGLIYMFPFAIFALVPLIVFLWNRPNVYRSISSEADNNLRSLHWVIFSLGASFTTAFVLIMMFFWSGMRYAADFLPSLTALSTIGLWQGYQLFEHNSKYKTAGILLAGISVTVSALLAISVL